MSSFYVLIVLLVIFVVISLSLLPSLSLADCVGAGVSPVTGSTHLQKPSISSAHGWGMSLQFGSRVAADVVGVVGGLEGLPAKSVHKSIPAFFSYVIFMRPV